ncbi:MAG: DedA family protein [Propionibacteriaceae bacterium]|jgi:membrane protein DedA with SNARE-associated domain|nr:DedA family protein [Propionibacteriaceae bacterium]
MSHTEEPNAEEKPWWDDPSLPWRHKPTRADLACWIWIAVVGIWALATLPLRAILIGWNPPIAAMIMGGRSSVVAAGAWTRVYGGPLVLYWVLAALSLVKFSWVYWWAGKLWGTNIIALLSGQSARAKKRAERAVRVTNRFSLLAIFLTFLPIPFPMPIVFAAIGAAGALLKRFLPPVIAISALFQAGYLALGWWIGEPAVNLVNLYAQYMWYVTIGILVVMLVGWWLRQRRERGQSESAPATAKDEPHTEPAPGDESPR